MSYSVLASGTFDKQIALLDKKSRKIIDKKIDLIEENPFRFKSIHSKKFGKIFRVRLSLEKKETRLIYVVLEPSVILVCLLNRKNDYKDLEKYLERIG